MPTYVVDRTERYIIDAPNPVEARELVADGHGEFDHTVTTRIVEDPTDPGPDGEPGDDIGDAPT